MFKIEPAQLLRVICTIVVALVFAAAGVQKILHNHETGTMLSAYLTSPDAVRALGCAELGLGLWLASFRLPRLAQLIAMGVLGIFTLLILKELMSENPRPCGCLETQPGQDPFAARRGLKLSVVRNAVLLIFSGFAILLAPGEERESNQSPRNAS